MMNGIIEWDILRLSSMNMDKEIEASLREFLVDIGCSHANDTRTGGKTDNWKIAIYERDGLQVAFYDNCLLYTSPSPRDKRQSRMPSSA